MRKYAFCDDAVGVFVGFWRTLLWHSGEHFCGILANTFVVRCRLRRTGSGYDCVAVGMEIYINCMGYNPSTTEGGPPSSTRGRLGLGVLSVVGMKCGRKGNSFRHDFVVPPASPEGICPGGGGLKSSLPRMGNGVCLSHFNKTRGRVN